MTEKQINSIISRYINFEGAAQWIRDGVTLNGTFSYGQIQEVYYVMRLIRQGSSMVHCGEVTDAPKDSWYAQWVQRPGWDRKVIFWVIEADDPFNFNVLFSTEDFLAKSCLISKKDFKIEHSCELINAPEKIKEAADWHFAEEE